VALVAKAAAEVLQGRMAEAAAQGEKEDLEVLLTLRERESVELVVLPEEKVAP
jgi:hypothetical protein